MLEVKAAFKTKETEIQTTDCVVYKVVYLSGAQFDSFSRNLMRDWDFIRDNPIETVVDGQGRYYCLLVLGEGRRDGILVNSEGSSYARHSAYLPGAAELLDSDRYPALVKLNQKLKNAVEFIMRLGSAGDSTSKYAVGITAVEKACGLSLEAGSQLLGTLIRMVSDRPEIDAVRFSNDELLVEVKTDAINPKRDVMALPKKRDDAQHWREDNRYRKHNDGVLYYLGGENGEYVRIKKDGSLTIGRYELARPGIEAAVLFPNITRQYANYEQAFLTAARLKDARFVSDIIDEKPSVLEQIREAKKAPSMPHVQKGGRSKQEPEL